MDQVIVHNPQGATILGGGNVQKRLLSRALRFAPVIVAADSGADIAAKAGLIPEVVIGDLDSLGPSNLPPEKLHFIDDQDSTDFEKCLARLDVPFAIAVGMTGSRLDHSLAALSALARGWPYPVFLLHGEDVAFRCPVQIALHVPPGTRLSLMPMAEARVRSTGLRWATDHLVFAPAGRIGTSNQSIAPRITLATSDPVLAILPAKHLGAVLAAFNLV